MGNENTYNNNAGSSDKCPKCGAVRMFSAIRCPACGADYAAVTRSMSSAGTGNSSYVNKPVNNFDPNASFSAYKRSIEPQDGISDGASDLSSGGSSNYGGTGNVTNQSSLSGSITEQAKPKLDPIAQKLQEMAKENSAATPNATRSLNQGAPIPGVYIPGASNQSSSYQGSQAQSPSYQGTSYQSQQFQGTQPQSSPMPGVYIPGASNQGSSYQGGQAQNASNQGSAYKNTQPQMRYQGRPDIQQKPAGQSGAQGGDDASPYSSPYSGSSYGNITETDGSGKFGKILRTVLLLAVLGVVLYGVYKLYNCDKNENGLAYTAGKVENDMYVNEWSGLKIDLTKAVSDYSSMMNDSSMQSFMSSLKSSFLKMNAELKAEFLGANKFKNFDTKTITIVPGIIVFTITDNSIPAKLFGAKTDDYFYEFRTSGGGPYANTSLTKQNDMVLSGHVYTTFRTTTALTSSLNSDMYLCVRAIGNKIVLICIYEIPGYYNLSTLQNCFVN